MKGLIINIIWCIDERTSFIFYPDICCLLFIYPQNCLWIRPCFRGVTPPKSRSLQTEISFSQGLRQAFFSAGLLDLITERFLKSFIRRGNDLNFELLRSVFWLFDRIAFPWQRTVHIWCAHRWNHACALWFSGSSREARLRRSPEQHNLVTRYQSPKVSDTFEHIIIVFEYIPAHFRTG